MRTTTLLASRPGFGTSVEVGPELWRGVPADPALYVDARLELAHRRLLAAAGRAQDVDHAVAEELLGLLVVAGKSPVPAGSRDRVMLAAAREAILAEDPGGLLPLAADLGCADQAQLSRTVRAHVGRTPGAVARIFTT